ncbi:MAG: ABC transporter ATP-binding protein [Candidatus Omnitrophota bacterium]
MRDYIRLLKFVKPYKALFALSMVFMFFSALFSGVSLAMILPLVDKIFTNKQIVLPAKMPAPVAGLVDRINNTDPQTLLGYIVIGIIVLFFLKGIFNFLQSYFVSDIGQRIVRDIRNKLFAKFQLLSLEYFTRKRGGELISRITNDSKLIENAVCYGLTDLVYEGSQVVIFTFMVFFIYAKLAIAVFLIMPVMGFIIYKVGRVLKKLSRQGQEKMADLNSLLYGTILGTRIVKAFNMEEYEIRKFNEVNNSYYKISMRSIKRMSMLSPMTEILGSVAGVTVAVIAGKEVMAGRVSFGVVGFFMASFFSLIRPFKKLSQVHSINQQAVAAGQRIFEVLDEPVTVAEKNNALELSGFKEKIDFQDIWTSYGSHEVLKGVNLTVSKGQVLAIVGPSGAGKTTLLDLIPRFYDPKKGRILIDGVDIKDFTLKSLRQAIGIVTQDTILFNDTIRANIAYGHLEASLENIERAAKQAHAHDFIKHLPQGYDTVIGDRGMKLSGGERQRIAIARALLKNPAILILDEATSQLDSHSERLVQEALDSLMQGRTVFVIAHRLSTVRNASTIVVLSEGKIVEQGSHSGLLDKSGLYKRLYQMQELQ